MNIIIQKINLIINEYNYIENLDKNEKNEKKIILKFNNIFIKIIFNNNI